MKTLIYTAIFAATASASTAQSMIDELCGKNHENEAASAADVSANPDGFYIASLAQQLSHGDPRIVLAVGDDFHLCTRAVATPGMDATNVVNAAGKRTVKLLFVPYAPPKSAPSS